MAPPPEMSVSISVSHQTRRCVDTYSILNGLFVLRYILTVAVDWWNENLEILLNRKVSSGLILKTKVLLEHCIHGQYHTDEVIYVKFLN